MPLLSLLRLPVLLAQDAAGKSITILQWLGVIIVLSVVIVAVALWVRRRLLAEDEEVLPESPGFTLADLRALHKAGKLTDQEFAAAKAGMIARSRAMLHPEEVDAGEFPTDTTPIEASDASTDAQTPDEGQDGAGEEGFDDSDKR